MTKKKLRPGHAGSLEDLADALGVSRQTASKMKRDGMKPERDGSWSIQKCAEFRDLRQSRASQGRNGAAPLSSTAMTWKEEALKADAQMKQLKLAEYASTLVKKEEVRREWARMIVIAKTKFESLGRDVAPKLVGRSPREVQSIIDKRIFEILRAMATNKKYGSSF